MSVVINILDIVVLVFIYCFVFLKRWKKRGLHVFILNTMMYIYICGVLYFTLMPIIYSILHIFDHSDGYGTINLIPLWI